MKVLVADKLEKSGLDGLAAIGCEVDSQPDLNGDALRQAVADSGCDVLIVRSTKVPAEAIEAGKLSLIVRAGAGYNNIDVDAASKHGVYVANCPGKNSIAVAELAFGLMIACDRSIPDGVAELRAGHWDKKRFSKARGLSGLTLGLVGMGMIAQAMIPRAKAFGMTVIAYSRWMTPEAAAALNIARAEDLNDLARQADVVSLHVALSSITKGMVDDKFLSTLRDGSILINTSRAEVIDQAALLKHTSSGRLKAGLDVFEGEPAEAQGSYDGPLREAKNVYCTHHIGASTEQAQEAVAAETVRIVADYKATGVVPNVINITKGEVATHLLVVRHQDKVGVLAHVLSVLKDEGVNVQEMENIVLGGAQSAIAQVGLDKEPSPHGLTAIKTHPWVFDASVLPITQ